MIFRLTSAPRENLLRHLVRLHRDVISVVFHNLHFELQEIAEIPDG